MLKLIAVSILLTSCGFNKTDEAIAKKVAEIEVAQVPPESDKTSDAKPIVKEEVKQETQATAQVPTDTQKEPSPSVVMENLDTTIPKPMPKLLSTLNCVFNASARTGHVKIDKYEGDLYKVTSSLKITVFNETINFARNQEGTADNFPQVSHMSYMGRTDEELYLFDIQHGERVFYSVKVSPTNPKDTVWSVGSIDSEKGGKLSFPAPICNDRI